MDERICKHCGQAVEEAVEANDGSVFCCEACAISAGYRVCEYCGEWHWPNLRLGGEQYCCDECAESDGYVRCERCGDWVHSDDAVDPSGDGDALYCSDGCTYDDGWSRCDRCDEWTRDSDLWSVHSNGRIEDWCESCRDYHATSCAECGDVYDDDELDEYRRCQNCCGSQHLHSYGYCPGIVFFGESDEKPPMYLGVELETDGGRNRGSYCDELDAIEGFHERFWMTEDSSLNDGVEITSQPMTLAHHIECMPIYEEIRDTASSYGFRSHDGGRCGLHVHVNRAWFGKSEAVQDAGGYKVMRLMQRFERQLMIFSRRLNDQWCRFRTSRDYTPKSVEPKILREYGAEEPSMLHKAELMKHETSHSQCLNFQHRSTYEFRIFRGTLKLETYFASLGFVDGICRTAVAHGSIWVEDVDWYTLVEEIVERCSEGYAKECLVAYLEEKGLR